MRNDPQHGINKKLDSFLRRMNKHRDYEYSDLYERFYDGEYDEEDIEEFDDYIEYFNNRD